MKLISAGSLGPLDIFGRGQCIKHLSPEQLKVWERTWQDWLDESPPGLRKKRWRYFLLWLVLRYTGCRLGEALLIRDQEDLDFRRGEIRLVNLKRKNKTEHRWVPVPQRVLAEIARFWAEYPELRGKTFQDTKQGAFRRYCREVFKETAGKAGIPASLSHPHVLRHSRAIELLRAGVPVTAVQQLLGHAYLSTTAIYLRLSGQEIRQALIAAGLI